MALADRRLLGQQPRFQQRLAHFLGERAVVAGEASRKMGELGVISAPLPHAVEPLEDPARRPQARIRVVVRRRDLAARAEQREHGVLELVERLRRVAAEPRDGLGDPQRMARADRLLERDVVDHPRWQRARRRPEPVDRVGLLLEGELDEVRLEGVRRDRRGRGGRRGARRRAGAGRRGG